MKSKDNTYAIEPCPDCGGIRVKGTGPHGPHWKRIEGRLIRVGCTGKPLNATPTKEK